VPAPFSVTTLSHRTHRPDDEGIARMYGRLRKRVLWPSLALLHGTPVSSICLSTPYGGEPRQISCTQDPSSTTCWRQSQSRRSRRASTGLEGYHEQHWRLIRSAAAPKTGTECDPCSLRAGRRRSSARLPSLRRIVAKGFPEIADLTEVSLLSALEPCRQFSPAKLPTGLRFQIYHYSFRVFLKQGRDRWRAG